MQIHAGQTPHDIAIEHYSKAIDRRPTFAQAYNYRGVAYGNIDKLDLAISDFNKGHTTQGKLCRSL